MKTCIRKAVSVSLLLFVLLVAANTAMARNKTLDDFGFGTKTFLIQSARESGKSTKGLWDVSGDGELNKYAKRKKKNYNIKIWEREKKDGKDRFFRFIPTDKEGVYYIRFAKLAGWYVHADMKKDTLKASKKHKTRFRLEYLKNGRWKIHTESGVLVGLKKRSSENGTDIGLIRKQNGPHVEWTFFNKATGKSFAPRKTHKKPQVEKPEPGMLIDVLEQHKSQKERYFKFVDAGQFERDNSNDLLLKHFQFMGKAEDQWNEMMLIVDAVMKNKDLRAKRAVLDACSRVDLEKGGNFAAKILQASVVKRFRDLAGREKDRISKAKIEAIADSI